VGGDVWEGRGGWGCLGRQGCGGAEGKGVSRHFELIKWN
jgi:hypothetical protein